MEEQYSFDLNLDFLDSSAPNNQENVTTTIGYQQTQLQPLLDIETLATRIASVDDLVGQLKKVKDEHSKLQKQMQELSDSAMSIRCMYEREKTERAKLAILSEELKEKCEQAESQLTNKTLHFEQLSSRLEQSSKKGPISYNDLALRYQRLALQLDDDKMLNPKEKLLLQQIQEYIESEKLTSLSAFKKKSHPKKQVHHIATECNLKADTKSQGTQSCPDLVKPAPKEMITQGTQYTWYTTTRGTNTPASQSEASQKELRSQGTQYISSTTTRATSTATFIKKHTIGTNFPEVMPVCIADILKEMICDVTPVSPIIDRAHVEKIVQPVKKPEMKSVSTNTGLNNVRKPIDYVQPSIKLSDSRPPSRNMYDRIKNESPFMGMPTINPFGNVGMNASPMHSTVAHLWNMLGYTIFGLLQNGGPQANQLPNHVVSDRNLGADMTRRRERQMTEPNTENCYFEENNSRDYLPSTRSTATSPISTTELDRMTSSGANGFDGIYMNLPASSSAFVSVPRTMVSTPVAASPPVEIQKILLNKSPQGETSEAETSAEKSSRVDEILKLFPEYSYSLQKRKALKRLLKKSNLEKKSRKSLSMSEAVERPQTQVTSDGGSDSDFYPQVDAQKTFPTQVDRCGGASDPDFYPNTRKTIPTNWEEDLFGVLAEEYKSCDTMEHPRAEDSSQQSFSENNSLDSSQCPVECRVDDGFIGFEELKQPLSSDEVFCKPFLPPIRRKRQLTSNRETGVPHLPLGNKRKPPNGYCLAKPGPKAKRKRCNSISDAKNSSKFSKVESSNVNTSLFQPLTTNMNRQAGSLSNDQNTIQQSSEEKRGFDVLEDHGTFNYSPTMEMQSKSLFLNQGTFNFSELQPPKLEKSSDSVYQDRRNCNSNESIEEKPSNSGLQDQKRWSCHDPVALRREKSPNPRIFNEPVAPIKEKCLVNSSLDNHFTSVFQNPKTADSHEHHTAPVCVQHDQRTSNSPEPAVRTEEKPENTVILGQEILNLTDLELENTSEAAILNESTTATKENPTTCIMPDEGVLHCNGTESSNAGNQETLTCNGLEATILVQSSQGLTEAKVNDECPMRDDPPPSSFSSPNSYDGESELSIDCSQSPKQHNSSSIDLSAILKTPERDQPMPEFKTPDKCNLNLSKALTSSTENLVEDFLLNASPGSDGPKFQVFLDKIMDEVAPPLSPISVMAPSETPLNSEAENSADDESLKPHSGAITIRKGRKKQPATAAIAVKRSARLKAKQNADTEPMNSLSLLNIPGIELGKYTKKATDHRSPLSKQKQLKSVVKPSVEEVQADDHKVDIICDIRLGFFKDLTEENDQDECSMLVIDEGPEETSQSKVDCSTTAIGTRSVEVGSISNPNSEKLLGRLPEKGQSKPSTHDQANILNELKSDDAMSLVAEAPEEWNSSSSSNEETKKWNESQAEEQSSQLISFNECPASPPPMEKEPEEMHIAREYAESAPTSTNPTSNSMISHIIANYNSQYHKQLTQAAQPDKKLLLELQSIITVFTEGLCLVMDCIRTVDTLLNHTTSELQISQALVSTVKTAPRPETELATPVPDLYLSQTLRKLLSLLEPLQHRLPNFQRNLQVTIEQSLFSFTKDSIPLEVVMNLTQFYLATIADPKANTNPARLFICKCLYFYNQKATPMIYETLCVYPSVLPKKEDLTYDRSDALINAIQCLLMRTFYEMDKTDMKTRQMYTKLSKFYNYESFKPPRDEVIENLLAKIRAGRFKNVSYAFALICKRMEQKSAEKIVLADILLPLANEYYHTLSETTENDERIACVLESISFIIKPFNLATDISMYTNLFGRFLNASERPIIQEAALAAHLRTIRFGYVNCFNAIYNFKPNYELAHGTKTMLKSFVYKKRLAFLKRLEHQAHVLLAK